MRIMLLNNIALYQMNLFAGTWYYDFDGTIFILLFSYVIRPNLQVHVLYGWTVVFIALICVNYIVSTHEYLDQQKICNY